VITKQNHNCKAIAKRSQSVREEIAYRKAKSKEIAKQLDSDCEVILKSDRKVIPRYCKAIAKQKRAE
jgi:hypothetical protein